MNRVPDNHLPPPTFSKRRLPTETIEAKTVLYRMHRRGLGPVYFGRSGDYRFDSPDSSYGVLYAAATPEACFVETLLREPGKDYVAMEELEKREITELMTSTEIRVARLHGPGLKRIGMTAAAVSGDYAIAQAWSQAIHGHPDAVAGISYRSVRDNDLICYAFFEGKTSSVFQEKRSGKPIDDHPWLGQILDRYGVGLG